MILVTPLFTFTYHEIMERRRWRIMQISYKKFKSEADLELYISKLLQLIHNRKDVGNRIKLEGIVKYHSKSCTKFKQNCPCRQIILDDT